LRGFFGAVVLLVVLADAMWRFSCALGWSNGAGAILLRDRGCLSSDRQRVVTDLALAALPHKGPAGFPKREKNWVRLGFRSESALAFEGENELP